MLEDITNLGLLILFTFYVKHRMLKSGQTHCIYYENAY